MRFQLFGKKKPKDEKRVEAVAPQNEYYERVSEKLGIAQVVLYLSLLAFVVLSFLGNTELITYHNFYYFIKDLNASAETVDVWNTDSVSYPTSDRQSFTLYRDGLAVAGRSNVTVFTATGRQTVSRSATYNDPVAVGRGKYLLVYDHGGRHYALYNSYTEIYSGETDHPISGAVVSDSGMYALISSSEEYNSVVSLYSKNFSLLNVYKKNGYVMDVDINPKGDTIALVTSSIANGLFSTELMACRVQETEALFKTTVTDSLALSCEFTENGTVGVLCSGGFYTYDTDGSQLVAHDFAGDSVAAFDAGEDGYAIVLKTLGTSERRHVLVFDKKGNSVYNGSAAKQVEGVARYGNAVYLKTAYGILRLDAKRASYRELLCNTEQRYLLAVNGNEFLLCSPQKAEYMSFE